MPKKKKIPVWKKLLIIAVLSVLVVCLTHYLLRLWLGTSPPEITDQSALLLESIPAGDNYWEAGKCRLRKSDSGLWEMYLEGGAFERGASAGKMCEELLKYQEDVFVKQIRQIIPSDIYLMCLRNFIAFFNRNLASSIPDEFKEEIYGISLSCTHEYDFIGTPYERQLNYHAAHDLGHAMKDYMLVGCTSFAAWNKCTEDSTLVVGRNFDFYAGDDFAKNKIVAFYKPAQGYPFASVTWAGMTGVLSGMNTQGLTVTINAAKSTMPTSTATPISILCREILQYASTIDEAVAIAGKRKIFVSESILIGSAKDNTAVIIEKSPDASGIYRSNKDWLVCANHFQSETFKSDARNQENIRTSDSPYRQQRTEELIVRDLPLSPEKAVSILRDMKGPGDTKLILGDEKAINQLIGHHSIVFAPQKGLMWVSTFPWQLGEYVAYDLNRIFSNPDFSSEIKIDSLTIAADPFQKTQEFEQFLSKRLHKSDKTE